ncbi:MAG: helix-turn-helix transcriptional regulator [Halobacteriota archaeon]
MNILLSKKQVREMSTISFTQIDRLEKAGNFPKRVRISVNRVGWVKSEIEKFIDDRIKDR